MPRTALSILALMVSLGATTASAAEPAPQALYSELRAFRLAGEAVRVSNLRFACDRIQMTFTGEFYFAQPVSGHVYGAVFLGEGALRTEPWSLFEKENVKRFLKSEVVEATFSRAVLRFTDETYEKLATGGLTPGSEPGRAQVLASELEDRLRRETGLNLSARLGLAIVNQDQPGVFFGEFDGGNRGRFSVLLDHQARVPDSVFGVNGGEKGLVFQYRGSIDGNDLWTAFYDQADFERQKTLYADAFDLVTIPDIRL